MEFLQNALWFIVAISVLVAAHEFGHFAVAKLCGVDPAHYLRTATTQALTRPGCALLPHDLLS